MRMIENFVRLTVESMGIDSRIQRTLAGWTSSGLDYVVGTSSGANGLMRIYCCVTPDSDGKFPGFHVIEATGEFEPSPYDAGTDIVWALADLTDLIGVRWEMSTDDNKTRDEIINASEGGGANITEPGAFGGIGFGGDALHSLERCNVGKAMVLWP